MAFTVPIGPRPCRRNIFLKMPIFCQFSNQILPFFPNFWKDVIFIGRCHFYQSFGRYYEGPFIEPPPLAHACSKKKFLMLEKMKICIYVLVIISNQQIANLDISELQSLTIAYNTYYQLRN